MKDVAILNIRELLFDFKRGKINANEEQFYAITDRLFIDNFTKPIKIECGNIVFENISNDRNVFKWYYK